MQWSGSAGENRRTTEVAPASARQQSVDATVAEAAQAGAQIIVFPEFTLDLDQRAKLVELLTRQTWPSLLMVVAGSFHEGVAGEFFNTAPLYCAATGEALLVHRKLRLFGGFDEGAEQVSVGNSVQVLVTPVGCITVLICKDFMDKHASVESLLTEVPVDWVLVPSFGDEKTIRAHKERARDLALVKTGTHTVVAQTLNTAQPRATPPTECVRGFGHAAGAREPEPPVGELGGLVQFALHGQSSGPPPKPSAPQLTVVK